MQSNIRQPQTEYTKLRNNMRRLTVEQKAGIGAILGAFTGDALGSYLEFKEGV